MATVRVSAAKLQELLEAAIVLTGWCRTPIVAEPMLPEEDNPGFWEAVGDLERAAAALATKAEG